MITHYKKEGFETLLIMEAWASLHEFYIKYRDFKKDTKTVPVRRQWKKRQTCDLNRHLEKTSINSRFWKLSDTTKFDPI